jgi:hypothetical protein
MSKPVRPVAGSCASESPIYFHLVWDSELEELEPVLKIIKSSREVVLDDWRYLYGFHFGQSRVLSDHDFLRIFGAELGLCECR